MERLRSIARAFAAWRAEVHAREALRHTASLDVLRLYAAAGAWAEASQRAHHHAARASYWRATAAVMAPSASLAARAEPRASRAPVPTEDASGAPPRSSYVRARGAAHGSEHDAQGDDEDAGQSYG